jgi:hypothetical protein
MIIEFMIPVVVDFLLQLLLAHKEAYITKIAIPG